MTIASAGELVGYYTDQASANYKQTTSDYYFPNVGYPSAANTPHHFIEDGQANWNVSYASGSGVRVYTLTANANATGSGTTASTSAIRDPNWYWQNTGTSQASNNTYQLGRFTNLFTASLSYISTLLGDTASLNQLYRTDRPNSGPASITPLAAINNWSASGSTTMTAVASPVAATRKPGSGTPASGVPIRWLAPAG